MGVSRRRSARYSGNHQRSWLWGRYAVGETLRAGRWPVMELLLDERFGADEQSISPWNRQGVGAAASTSEGELSQAELLQLLQTFQGPIQRVPAERLTQLAGQRHHQGILARMGEYPCLDAQALPQPSLPSGSAGADLTPDFWLLCDRIRDASNFGGILRTAEAAGVRGVVIGEKDQCEVTPHVCRASAGAVNHLKIVRTAGLDHAVDEFRAAGFRILAATEHGECLVWQLPSAEKTLLLIGSESDGISTSLLQKADTTARIPMQGHVGSLNAAVAAAIIIYEISRQQSLEANKK